MASERTGLWATAVAAVGAAALVFGLLPGAWPNPLPDGPIEGEPSVQRLHAAAAVVDAACERGDLQSFEGCVTEQHRERLVRQLAAVDRQLDGQALREFGGDAGRYSDLLRQPWLAGEVRGTRAVVAVARAHGDGAQVVSFVWDGRALRLDGSVHAAFVTDEDSAELAVATAVAERGR